MKILSRLSLLILLLFWAGCSTMPSGGAKTKRLLCWWSVASLEDSPGSVSLSSAEDHFSVKFADDGIGFVKVAPGPVTGQGGALANIRRERGGALSGSNQPERRKPRFASGGSAACNERSYRVCGF